METLVTHLTLGRSCIFVGALSLEENSRPFLQPKQLNSINNTLDVILGCVKPICCCAESVQIMKPPPQPIILVPMVTPTETKLMLESHPVI